MRYPADETAKKHDRLVREASRLFRKRGFKDVSIAEVMKAAGLTHGAFYSHFESKEALVAAAIDNGMNDILTRVTESFSSKAGKGGYADAYLSIKHRDGPERGCTMAALATDIRNEPAAQPTFTAKLKEILDATGIERGEAIMLMSAMVGAMALARAVSDKSLSAEILREVRVRLQL